MKHVGMTILEVLISLAILGGAVAVIGEFARLSFRNASDATDLTQAVLLAESVLAKVQLGIIEQESAFDVPVTDSTNANDIVVDTNAVEAGNAGNPLWYYTLEVNTIDDYGLLEIAVTVRQNKPEEYHPVSCRLVRWFAPEPEEEE